MDFFANLTHLMMTNFRLFKKEENQALLTANTTSHIGYVITQYYFLVRHIVKMLLTTQARARDLSWVKVVANLGVNLGQELGSETGGVSHARILRRGLQDIFGLDVGPADEDEGEIPTPENATGNFLKVVFDNLNGTNPFVALGTTYALECSAVPELRIVYELVGRMTTLTGKTVTESLQDFFDMHLQSWEPSHEAGLRLASAKYLQTDADREAFRTGFITTIEAMEEWWAGMANEAARL